MMKCSDVIHPDVYLYFLTRISIFRKSVDGGRDLSDLLDKVNTLQNSLPCMRTH
jgi:hypothetical protein